MHAHMFAHILSCIILECVLNDIIGARSVHIATHLGFLHGFLFFVLIGINKLNFVFSLALFCSNDLFN